MADLNNGKYLKSIIKKDKAKEFELDDVCFLGTEQIVLENLDVLKI